MSRTANSTIRIQASPIGLTLDVNDTVSLYYVLNSNNINIASVTVQQLLDGYCIPSGVIPATVNEVYAYLPAPCNYAERIDLQPIYTATPTPTITPSPNVTPTPTVTPTTLIPTATPTPTTSPVGWFRTDVQISFDDASCEPTLPSFGPWYFYPNQGAAGNYAPVAGARIYLDANLTQYWSGTSGWYGILDYSISSQASLHAIQVDNSGYVTQVRDSNCSGGGGGTTS